MEHEFEIRDTKRKGDISEHYAVTWLWEQGYEVFKNSGCSGAIDLIAMDSEGNMTLIDVKTAKKDSRRKVWNSRSILWCPSLRNIRKEIWTNCRWYRCLSIRRWTNSRQKVL